LISRQTKIIVRFNLLGQVAATSGLAFGLAGLISTVATVKTNYDPTPGKNIAICVPILTSWALINTFGRKMLRYLLYIAVALNSVGVLALAIAVLAKAPVYQSASFVFRTFVDGTGVGDGPGWSVRASPAYVACCGCLVSQFALLGYDASAHLAEETRRASRFAPIGIISSLGLSALLGLFLLLALLFSIQDVGNTLATSYNQPVLQILVDIFGEDGGIVLFMFIICCVWNCGLFCMTSSSRLIFAFSRDRAIVSVSQQ
jgi:amino acid transporter